VILVCITCTSAQLAQAGETSPQNSLFLPSGKSQATEALEAKRSARCVALYGPGYGALGDSDTCIRIGGRIGVGVQVGGSTKHNRLILVPSPGIGAPAPALGGPVVGVVRRPSSSTGTETAAQIYVDTHTPTEFGDFGTHLSVGGVRASGALRGPDCVH
jgi:hypothetical protein